MTAIGSEGISSRAPAPDNGKRWQQLALLTSVQGGDNSELNLLTGLFPAIKTSLGLSLGDLGVLTAANRIAGALFGGVWIWLARRWSRKAVLVIASGVWSLWAVAAGFAGSFVELLVFYSILAMGVAGAQALITEIVADLFDDATRGRAVGYMYGALNLLGSVLGPAFGQLSGFEEGWRIAFWILGAANALIGFLIWAALDDPGLGASEGKDKVRARVTERPSLRSVASILKIPTFSLMLVSRALSGHLLVISFGVTFLTAERGFSNGVASLVLAPFGIGYFIGAIGGGIVVDRMHRSWPDKGRILFLQAAQVGFAVIAFFGTQFDWGSIDVFCVFWLLMGLMQGVNPGVNRPIVMSVVRPELRGWAFTIMVALVESAVWAAYNLAAGWLGDKYGLQPVFLVALVGAMLLNGAVITLLYRTYPRDVELMNRGMAGATK